MLKKLVLLISTIVSASSFAGAPTPIVYLNGVFSGPLPPPTSPASTENKGFGTKLDLIELYIDPTSPIGADLFNCAIRIGVNPPISLPSVPVAPGDFIYLVNDPMFFDSYFGPLMLTPPIIPAPIVINTGTEDIELICGGVPVDIFNIPPVFIVAESFAHRNTPPPSLPPGKNANNKGPGPFFNPMDWTFQGPGNISTCVNDVTCHVQYPMGTLPVELQNFSIE